MPTNETEHEGVTLIDIDPLTTTETAVMPSVIDAVVVDDLRAQALAAVPSPLPSPPSPPVSLTPAQENEDARDGIVARQKGNGSELTHYETLAILDLYHNKKLTQMQIAKRLNVNQSTVSRTLSKYQDTTVLAKKQLLARSEEILEKIIEKGEAKDLIKLLKGTKAPDGSRIVEADREYGVSKGKDGGPNVFVGVKVNVE